MQTQNKDIIDLIVEMNDTLKTNPMLETIAKSILTKRQIHNINVNDKLTESETEQINKLVPVVPLPAITFPSPSPSPYPAPSPSLASVVPSAPAPAPSPGPAAASSTPAPGLGYPVVEEINDTHINTKNFDNLVKTISDNITNQHVGIENTGDICYFSSYVQMLSYIPEFVQELITRQDQPIEYKIDRKNITIKTYYKDVINIFYNLYSGTIGTPIGIINPIFYNSGEVIKKQEDTHDSIMNFFARINLNLEYFKVNIQSNNKCLNGRNISNNEQKELFLSLSINTESKNIVDLINNFLKEEEVEDYIDKENKCDQGKDAKIKIKKNSYLIIPNNNKYLLLQLKRFDFNSSAGTHVAGKIKQKIELNKIFRLNNIVGYKLYGAIKHTGEKSHNGHYIFYKIDDNFVIEYNDSTVTQDSYDKYKDELETNGYIIIYKREDTIIGGDRHYQKYLKYKNKYLKLKNQVS